MRTTLSKFTTLGVALITVAAMLISPAVWCDDKGERIEIEDFERARQLVSEGKIVSLNTILEKVEILPGWRLLEIEFDRDDGRWIYELEFLKEDGDVIELEYDAASGAFLGVED